MVSGGDFREELLRAGYLVESGSPGVYHRSFEFEKIVGGLETYISAAAGDDDREQLQMAPLILSSALVRSDYLASYPDLVGVVSSYDGSEAALPSLVDAANAGSDWAHFMSPTGLGLCGAACHNLYPLLSDSSIVQGGIRYEVQATCFRREPSVDVARMLSFRMREFVYIGSQEGALEHRRTWLDRGVFLLEGLGLSVATVIASDPFFGRAGKLIAAAQQEKERKFEMVAAITSETGGAVGSANYHEDHFGRAFNLVQPTGEPAHSACVGFGLERIGLSLFFRFGMDVAAWPESVRQSLHL